MPGRRHYAAFVAMFTLPLSACLHINAPGFTGSRDETSKNNTKATTKTNDTPAPQSPRIEFASLAKAPPGTVVQIRPQPNTNNKNTTQKPIIKPPIQPEEKVKAAISTEPGPFPPFAQVSTPPEAPLLAAVRAYTEGQPERAIEIIRKLDKQNQDFVLAVLPILARGANADLNNDAATIGVLVDQLYAAAARLEPRAALRVENVKFCKNVSGYGRYVPLAANEPYKSNTRAELYLEVKNLVSRPSGSEFITHIHATVEVRDAHGKVVEQIDPDDWRRRVPTARFDQRLISQSPLRDFHVLYTFSAPPAPGVYTIVAELRDATTGRSVKTQPVQFCVAGQ